MTPYGFADDRLGVRVRRRANGLDGSVTVYGSRDRPVRARHHGQKRYLLNRSMGWTKGAGEEGNAHGALRSGSLSAAPSAGGA